MEEHLTSTRKERVALVLCDIQADLLGSLTERESLLSAISIALEAAEKNDWLVVHNGLRFQQGYNGISRRHKLYGGLVKLNEKLGDEAVHWFMEGHSGSEIIPRAMPPTKQHAAERAQQQQEAVIVWRSQHIPNELGQCLRQQNIEKAYIVGAKASGAVQAAVQVAMDQGIEITVVKECVQDDDPQRLQAMLEHLFPVYANVISLKEMMDDLGGLDSFREESKQSLIQIMSGGKLTEGAGKKTVLHFSDCGRRGHGSRFMDILEARGGWKSYPTQTWYEDFIKGEFKCPLAKKVVDFCDEPEFSKISMYLAGREHLDEKDKVIETAGQFMPKTFCIENGQWVNGEAPPSDDEEGATVAPWFVKEADKNLGGDAIVIVSKPSQTMDSIGKNQRYVVQQHIRDPLLTDDGHKAHLKFYVLLICEADGVTWTLYTYEGALLSISPNPWSPTDLSQDTQITIHRHPIPPGETKGWMQHWETVYEKCKRGTANVIQRAIETKKLKGRQSKKQFEVFSVDWMPDEHGNIFMFEFNMSPAVCQREFDDPTNRDARRDALMKHDEQMLQEALSIAIPWEGGNPPGLWDLAGEFKGTI